MPATIELSARLTAIVAAKLGVPVTFDHWERHATGDVPVFNVPQSHALRARELGLEVA